MLHIEPCAGELEGVTEEGLVARQHLLDVLGPPAVPAWLGEVRSVVSEHGVDFIGHHGREVAEEVASHTPRRLLVQLRR